MTKKYGRTFHLPISPGATSDDKRMSSIKGLMQGGLIVTEKMDGENSTIHHGGTHARSPDSRYHPSRDWLKSFAAGVMHQLAADERIVGENLFAQHSLRYDNLPSYFLGFSWILGDMVQSWPDTVERFGELGITSVPVLHCGPYRDGLFETLATELDTGKQEGFVVRTEAAFHEDDMPERLGKYVRSGHVKSDLHWMKMDVVPNKLA